MLKDNTSPRALPDIWGEGALFAFSGVDGHTSVQHGMVGTLLGKRYGILFHTPTRRVLTIIVPDANSMRIYAITGDVIWVLGEETPLIITWAHWHTLVGLCPTGTQIVLSLEGQNAETIHEREVTRADDGVILLIRSGQQFALAYGENEAEAEQRAQHGLTQAVEGTANARLDWFGRFRARVPAHYQRLAHKCLSVMKVNTLAPEGTFADYWSTPDRVPHRNLWLWDSVFHSFAMNHVDPDLSWLFLKSVLDMQNGDGMIPIQGSLEGVRASQMTQPPLLAWGVWRNYQFTGNQDHLRYAFAKLEAYLQWNLDHRDTNNNGLLEWDIEEYEYSRSGESGMDNSSRFDAALTIDAVDFSVFQAHDMYYLSKIAAELGKSQQAEAWASYFETMSANVQKLLWDGERSLYMDRHLDETLSDVEAVSGFLPLLLDNTPSERVDQPIATLQDKTRFNTAFPVPTVSIAHPTWSTDMWRGATWLNMNYLIIQGLRLHGRNDVAMWLRDRSLTYVHKYYEQYGVIFEFFDAKDERTPPECDRKGPRQTPYDVRVKFDSVRDFHWSAALTLDLLVQ